MNTESKVKISEARLNDLAYMALKRYYFESLGMPPRECDIRICMDMAAPERITSLANAVLLPSEVAGKSHTITYEVDTDRVLEVALDYVENHWMKEEIEEEAKAEIREDWKEIVPVLLALPEDQCALSE